jgi:hypothetical protein
MSGKAVIVLSFGDKDLVIVAIAHNGLSFGDKDLVIVAIRPWAGLHLVQPAPDVRFGS